MEGLLTNYDHTQHLKDTYWQIKYREWQPIILFAPLVTLTLGLISGLIIGARYFPDYVPIDRVVPTEVVKEVHTTNFVPSDSKNKIVTYANFPCKPRDQAIKDKTTNASLPANTSLLLPRGCIISIRTPDRNVVVFDSTASRPSKVLLSPDNTVTLTTGGDLYVLTGEQGAAVEFLAWDWEK